jgi:hypothetical protein
MPRRAPRSATISSQTAADDADRQREADRGGRQRVPELHQGHRADIEGGRAEDCGGDQRVAHAELGGVLNGGEGGVLCHWSLS